MHNHHIHHTVVVLQSDLIENNLTSKHMFVESCVVGYIHMRFISLSHQPNNNQV